MVNNNNDEINEINIDNSEKIIKKSEKLFKSQKLAKLEKKLSKSENLFKFDIIKAGPSFLTFNTRMAFNYL